LPGAFIPLTAETIAGLSGDGAVLWYYHVDQDFGHKWDNMLVEQFRKQYMDNEEQEGTGDEEGKERA
jgi:hypothetical protein